MIRSDLVMYIIKIIKNSEIFLNNLNIVIRIIVKIEAKSSIARTQVAQQKLSILSSLSHALS